MDTEPLEIRRIFDSVTGAILSPAVLTEFTINGDPWSAPALQGPSSSGVSVITRDSLRCEPPCKFGGEAGNYEFLVLTEGYQPKRVKFFVDWLEKIPNHPCTLPTLRGETEVEIGLEKKR